MKISVLISTYNGAEKIIKALDAIKNQTEAIFEVLVLIDGSTDGTLELLENYTGINSLRTLQQPNGGRSKIRNFGAKAATGDLLIFFDDDMRPEADCVTVHLAHHKIHPDTILTGAQIDLCAEDFPDIRKYRAFLTAKWAKEMDVLNGQPMEKHNLFLTAANLSIPKKVFELLGGFDERLTDAEDYDLAERANAKGIKLYYCHSAFAWHEDVIDIRRYIKRLRQYNIAQQKLNELKPSFHNKYTSVAPKGAKALFFQFFCSKYWIRSIDKNIWPNLLPQSFRYKLYDWIITANGVYFPNKINL